MANIHMIEQALSPEILSQLVQVLNKLVAEVDNKQRAATEDELNNNWLHAQPGLLLSGLANILRSHPDPTMRSFAAIILRRCALRSPVISQDSLAYWLTVGDQVTSYVKTELLRSLAEEQEASVRRKVCDTIAEIVKYMLLKSLVWGELIEAVYQCTRAPTADHRESAMRILAAVPGLITSQEVEAVKNVFQTAFQDPNVDVQMTAFKAYVSYLLDTNAESRQAASSLIPTALSAMHSALEAKAETQVMESLSYFIDLAEFYPKTLRPVMPRLVPYMIQIMSTTTLEAGTRHTALELLLTLAESASAMMRKQDSFAKTIIPQLLEWMADVDDDQEWYTTTDLEDMDNEDFCMVGEQAMDRLARCIGGKTVVPITFSLIPKMISSPEWQKRYSALMAISSIGEGCIKIIEPELANVLSLVAPYIRDPHPRVRYAACNTLGQMSTDFAPTVQETYHALVVPALLAAMEDVQFPRVQAHAACALVNFTEDAEKQHLEPYLDGIFQRLLVLLNTDKMYLQEQAITSIATVADSAGDKFIKYYGAIMPLLIGALRQATQKELRLLRGKAMECASLIALAVGKDMFAPNAAELIDLLKTTQAGITEQDDPQSSYLLAAWARICKTLGHDFAPYLDIVMPPLLKSAQIKPDFAVCETEEEILEKFEDGDNWQFVEVEGQRIGIKTDLLEEKCTAVEMVMCYARELGAEFDRYVDTILSIVIPLLKFYFHDGVRLASAAVIPQLFESMRKANAAPARVSAHWDNVSTNLMEVINQEIDPSFLCQFYVTFTECIECLGPNCLSPQMLESYTQTLKSELQEHFKRIAENARARKDEDFDAEDEEGLAESQEDDDSLLSEFSKSLQMVIKLHGAAYLPCFEGLLIPILQEYQTSSSEAARQFAVCAWDDVIEYMGPISFSYHNRFWEVLVRSLQDTSVEVRQAAAYGVGQAAQHGGPSFAPLCTAAIPNLFALVNIPDARSEENVLPTENAISAVGKICKYYGSSFDVNPVLGAWLLVLPVIEDQQEAPFVYEYLIELIESNNGVILGQSNANIPRLIGIFAHALTVEELVSDELSSRMAALLKSMIAAVGSPVLEPIWASLPEDKRRMLTQKGIFS
ncbi:hypothetical protein SmJEL517_g05575 [Synchytrium microbalum]|uniref:TOG domain-containing protein n=1 Tax=Synchytrium microbalum TaxID=1806994 RepID=A0A507BUM1_9FUNG|nr:uncharacterized protein SmJEL517_g05575 [Synchytrium microbalum]TPX30988.1 hypothetical protein SmJEL517_g05575 [Synchytrium microbalum]